MGTEKPKSVEVGQQYRFADRGDKAWKVVGVDPGPRGCVRLKSDDGGDLWWFPGSQYDETHVTYLGMSAPPPAKGRGMEALPDGGPARCLKCGGDKGARVYTCESCCFAMAGTDEWNALTNSWERGSRDFPRSPAPSQEAPKCGRKGMLWSDGRWMPCPGCAECPRSPMGAPGETVFKNPPSGWQLGMPNLPKPPLGPVPVYGRMVGETRDANGVPLTALQAIQARKPPEPWVPSCDEDHWIPTVGERGWR